MTKPRLLDLFCGGGGCSRGYAEAGFDVTGVDIAPQKHYPYPFVQGDARAYLAAHGHEYDVIHASPPCQGYSALATMHPDRKHPLLIAEVRKRLQDTGKPYIIENVERATLDGVVLCGSMFDLRIARGWLRRHRKFETSFFVWQPECRHPAEKAVGVYGHGGHSGKHRMLCAREAAEIMRIDWMNRDELAQAIPWVYTQYIGGFAIEVVRG